MENAGKVSGAVLSYEEKMSRANPPNPYGKLRLNTDTGEAFSCMLFSDTHGSVRKMALIPGDAVEVTWKHFGKEDDQTGKRGVMGTFVRRTEAASAAPAGSSTTAAPQVSSPRGGGREDILHSVLTRYVTDVKIAHIRAGEPVPSPEVLVEEGVTLYEMVGKRLAAKPVSEAQESEEADLCEAIGEFGVANPKWKKFKTINYKGWRDSSDVMELVLVLLRQTAQGKWVVDQSDGDKILFSAASVAEVGA